MKIFYICIGIFIYLGATDSLPNSVESFLGLVFFLGLIVFMVLLGSHTMKS